jgi:hypothetical protein
VARVQSGGAVEAAATGGWRRTQRAGLWRWSRLVDDTVEAAPRREQALPIGPVRLEKPAAPGQTTPYSKPYRNRK